MKIVEYYNHIFTTSNSVTNGITCYSKKPTIDPVNGFFTAIDDSHENEKVSIPVKDVILVRSIPVFKGEEAKNHLKSEVKTKELELVKDIISVLSENKDKIPNEVGQKIFKLVRAFSSEQCQ